LEPDQELPEQDPWWTPCFPAGTLIDLANGKRAPIENVAPGDLVTAFDSFGNLSARKVTRIFRNTTESWVELTFDGASKRAAVIATPEHRFLTEDGSFHPIGRMLRLGGGSTKVVLADGSLAVVKGRLIAFSAETSELFEQSTVAPPYVVEGSAMRAAEPRRGWLTYNFEVEGLHTYIANGVRVHNDCDFRALNFIPPRDADPNDPWSGPDLRASNFDPFNGDPYNGNAPDDGYGGYGNAGVGNSATAEADSGYASAWGDSNEGSGDDGGDDGGDGGDGDGGEPVVLDLDGNGINITPLNASNTYFDMAGDGWQHRTAWAGAGDGVLVLDPNGTGQITQRNQVVFTDWDPTAVNDMQALRDVFDTNHNGKLDAGDAQWSSFKIMVTNADGTTTLKTMAQAGVQSIDLTPDSSTTVLPDGSRIDGVTSFTKTDGTVGIAATASLHYDSNGYAVQQTVTHNTDGSTTIDNKARTKDGVLASEISTTTSADGRTKTTSFDRNGDGVTDQIQTDVTVLNADGSRTETLTDTTGAGVLIDRTVTTTSADGKTIAIGRDANGDGVNEQTETRTTNADGSKSIAVANFNLDGSLVNRATTTTSADGFTQIVQTDMDGNGANDSTTTDSTVVAVDGSRTETLTDTNADGSLRDRSVTSTSADGRTKTTNVDLDGNSLTDVTKVAAIVVNADGSSSTSYTETNRDGSLRDRSVTAISADGLSRATQVDLNGDGFFDLISNDITVVNADGSRTQTTSDYNGNATLRDKTVVTRGADGRSRTVQVDVDGDGQFDGVETIVLAADGSSVDTLSEYNPNGSLKDKAITTTSANGLTSLVLADFNGDGIIDLATSAVTVLNADGSSTETVTDQNANGSLRDRTVTTTSANGLSSTTAMDITGDGVTDLTVADVLVVNADGSRIETVSDYNANGSLRDRTISTTSSDRKTTTITRDLNGDGIVDQTQTTNTLSNGSVVNDVSDLNRNGSLRDKIVTTTSANGLSATTQTDANGDSTFDLTTNDVTVLNANGSRTETITDLNANGSLRDKTVTTTSATGLSKTVQVDRDGNGTFEQNITDVTVLNADGSKTETITSKNANGAVVNVSAITTSGNGLSTTTQSDLNGDGVFDRIRTDVTILNIDGSRTEAVTDRNVDSSLRDQMITTTSADGRSVTIQRNTNGDSALDQTETIAISANGAIVDTVVDLNPNGTAKDGRTTTTSADGMTQITYRDLNGDGATDRTESHVTTLNADGSTTDTFNTHDGSALVETKTIVTSADGRSRTTTCDYDANGTTDLTTTDVTVVNPDGSQVNTVTASNSNGSLRAKTVTTTSADQNTINITRDMDGDTRVDQTEAIVIQADGSKVDTVSNFTTTTTTTSTQPYPGGAGGSGSPVTTTTTSLKDKKIVTTSANNLSTTTQFDNDGDGTIDETLTDVIVLNGDGSRTETLTQYNGTTLGTVKDKVVTTTSANGLSSSVQWDGVNGSIVLHQSTTDVTTINADGSRTEVISDFGPIITPPYSGGEAPGNNGGSTGSELKDRLTIITAANGLSASKQLDLDGNGTVDRVDAIVYGIDGSETETVTLKASSNGALQVKDVITTSADGRIRSLQRDTDGDNIFDHFETVAVNSDGSTTETAWNTTATGTPKDRVVTTTSANGFTKTQKVDSDGDGVIDWSSTITTVLNADGSRVETQSMFNANGTLRNKAITTTSANGYSSTVQLDTNGDGVVDQARNASTVINADGTTNKAVVDTYSLDNSLKDRVTTAISADGRITTTQTDIDGDGVIDKTDTYVMGPDGSAVNTRTYFDPSGNMTFQVTTTVSFDGLTTISQPNDGPTETITRTADGSGSYSYSDDQSSTSHMVDAAGIDTWTWSESGIPSAAIHIDLATEQRYLDVAARLYDTAFDRGMWNKEKEFLAKYIVNGALDTTQLANDLIGSEEFYQKIGGTYGGYWEPTSDANIQFVEHVYQNAFGRGASLAELTNAMSQLASGTMSRAGLMVAVSESAEHVADGNTHVITNNTDRINGSFQTQHTIDKTKAEAAIKRLYDTALDRDATASEISSWSQQLLSGSMTEADIAKTILVGTVLSQAGQQVYPTEFSTKYGQLSNIDFVRVLFMNSLDRVPSSTEAQLWTSLLSSGLTRAQFFVALAESTDHLGTGNTHSNALVSATTSTLSSSSVNLLLAGSAAVSGTGNTLNNLMVGNSGNNVLSGMQGDDVLIGEAGADTLNGGSGTDTASYLSSSAGVTVSLAANAANTGGDAQGDTLSNMENLTGSAFNDALTGDAANNVLAGGTGNDTLTGNAGNDVLKGDAGNDTLVGGAGYDTYVFGRGGGQDIIVNGAAGNAGPSGEVDFGSDINANQLWFKQAGNDLIVSILGSQDQITVSNWFSTNTSRLQEFELASGLKLDSGVAQLVQAMATYSNGNPSFNPASVTQLPPDAALQSTLTAAWH
jgi:hypothetical protein